MIKVQVRRATNGAIDRILVTGHAKYAEEGQDIVCAGVSALVATALIGIRQVADHPYAGEVTSGRMFCQIQPGGSSESAEKAQVILQTTLLGLKDIAKDYPHFVRVTEGG